MKTCPACLAEKPATTEHFYGDGTMPDKLKLRCKACYAAKVSAKRATKGDSAREIARAKYAADPERGRSYTAKWRAANPEKDKAGAAAYVAANPDKVRESQEKWRLANLDKVNAKSARARARNKLRYTVSTMVWNHLKRSGARKDGLATFHGLLGYTKDELRTHVESLFRPGMTWDNYGAHWELDHKIPLCKLPVVSHTDENFRKAWALSNLQPLTVHENRSKGGRILELSA